MNDPNTIVLQGDLGNKYDEGRCGSTSILPGHLIEPTSASDDQDNMILQPHSTAGGDTNLWVAVEDDFLGKTIDDAYVEDDPVRFHKAQKGDRLWVFLEEGENVAFGDLGSSNGDGTFQKVAGTEKPLVRFLQALDLSAVLVDTRVRVEVL